MSDGLPKPFGPGRNIALKVPASRYDETVAFYRDTVMLEHLDSGPDHETFAFGSMRLWIDCVAHATHAEVWLELRTDNLEAGADRLANAGARIVDELEPLDGVDGHWVQDPAGTVLLLVDDAEEPSTELPG